MNANDFLLNTNQTDGADGTDGDEGSEGSEGREGRTRDGAEKGQRGEGAARRRVGKMRGGLNWQHGEGRESIYKTIKGTRARKPR